MQNRLNSVQTSRANRDSHKPILVQPRCLNQCLSKRLYKYRTKNSVNLLLLQVHVFFLWLTEGLNLILKLKNKHQSFLLSTEASNKKNNYVNNGKELHELNQCRWVWITNNTRSAGSCFQVDFCFGPNTSMWFNVDFVFAQETTTLKLFYSLNLTYLVIHIYDLQRD